MIKLILTDMNRTLLNNNKELSNKIYSLVNKLDEKDIMFCAASDRQYYNLLNFLNLQRAKEFLWLKTGR